MTVNGTQCQLMPGNEFGTYAERIDAVDSQTNYWCWRKVASKYCRTIREYI